MLRMVATRAVSPSWFFVSFCLCSLPLFCLSFGCQRAEAALPTSTDSLAGARRWKGFVRREKIKKKVTSVCFFFLVQTPNGTTASYSLREICLAVRAELTCPRQPASRLV